jgi:tetratricopeptide (TPR) repeat protein
MKNLIQENYKWIVFGVILAFYASFLLVKISLPMADNDAGLYITDGKVIWESGRVFRNNIYSYTVPDYPVYDHHWLSSVSFYLIERFFGFSGLTIFKTLILLSAFTLLFLTALKKADFWLVAALSFPTILILSQRNRIRPEMFSYLFIAFFLYLLFDLEEHPERKRVFWLIPLQFLWVNFHLFFFVGIMLVGGFLFEKMIYRISNPVSAWKRGFQALWSDPVVRKLAIIVPLLVAVVFINPNGIEGALAPLRTHSYSAFTVTENQPLFNLKASILTWNVFSSAFVPMIAIFIFSFGFGFRRRPIFFFLAGLGAALAGLVQMRLVTIFAIMFLPAVSSNFTEVYYIGRDWFKRKWPYLALFAGYGLAAIIVFAFPYMVYRVNAEWASRGYDNYWGIGLDRYSNSAGEFFKTQGFKGPIFNDYDIGGYIIYHLFPRERIFVDNNGADSYPVSFFSDVLMPSLTDDEKWLETDKKYGLNSIFIASRDASPSVGMFLWKRMRDPAWALVYADTYALIFLKNIPENQDAIKNFLITPNNVMERIGYLLDSDELTDRIVAGRIMYLVGREDLSTSVFKKVVAEYPKNSGVWLYMGSIKALKDDPSSLISAIIFLENAVNMGEKTAEGYTWLGLAYFKFGQFEKAENAFQKALWFEPGRYDATDYLRQLQSYLTQ